MQAPGGGYWSTLDADSEGHEGKFYVWDAAEVRALLPAPVYAAFARRFGLDREPPTSKANGICTPIARRKRSRRSSTSTRAEVQRRLAEARQILLPKRNARVWPGRDEKILTSWNGLAIGGMAVAARVLGRPDFADSATRAVDFIREHLFRDGRLLAVHKDGQSRFAAYLDDYAFLLDALLELLQTRWRSSDLQLATALADALLEHFTDGEHGGFYFTADDHEQLMHRSKSFGDEAVPAGNGDRGPGVDAARAAAGRNALSRCCRAHAARGVGSAAALSARARVHAGRARRASRPAGTGHHPRATR